MKKKPLLFFLVIIAALCAVIPLSSCENSGHDSIKAITKPYIAQYECYEATYGGQDFLKNYDYIKVTFLDGKELEVSFKRKNNDKKHAFKCDYTVDPATREFTADVGVLGVKFQQSTIIKDGKFTISRQIMRKELMLKFQMS